MGVYGRTFLVSLLCCFCPVLFLPLWLVLLQTVGGKGGLVSLFSIFCTFIGIFIPSLRVVFLDTSIFRSERHSRTTYHAAVSHAPSGHDMARLFAEISHNNPWTLFL